MMTSLLPPSVVRLIDAALEEDLGGGDVTSRLTIPDGAQALGRVVARRDLVLSGVDVFELVFSRVDSTSVVTRVQEDGRRVGGDRTLLEVQGSAASILAAERVALNYLQHLCGVATLTASYVAALPEGSSTRITDTRKTTPGLRFLERRAVRHGGGWNHRDDLSGGILVKENHIAAAGGIGRAVERCRRAAPHPLKVEVEVRTREELSAALAAGADAVLLDNMTLEGVERCVELVAGRAFVEVSGGVSIDVVEQLAISGVDAISVGALTHSAPAADVSLLLQGT